MVAPVSGSARPHRAARAEARLHALVDRRLRERGWGPTVTPFVGYGAEGWVRVLARVLLRPPGAPPATDEDGRGWRRFLCASAAEVPVTVRLGGRTLQVTSVRDGYLDVRLRCDLEPGWHTALLATAGTDPVEVPVRVVAPGARLGVVSDIDDTVMVTSLPRAMLSC